MEKKVRDRAGDKVRNMVTSFLLFVVLNDCNIFIQHNIYYFSNCLTQYHFGFRYVLFFLLVYFVTGMNEKYLVGE